MSAERISDPEVLARILAAGGLVLSPTDTLPGLHCRHDIGSAIARLNVLKGREPNKPLVLLCSSVAQALGVASAPLPARIEQYISRCWPGPFTLILPVGSRLLAPVTGVGRGVALRVPALSWLSRLVAAAGAPVASTSANRSGQIPCVDIEDAAALFQDKVDAVGVLPPGERVAAVPEGLVGRASALIDLTAWPPRLLRQGPVPPPPWTEGGVEPEG